MGGGLQYLVGLCVYMSVCYHKIAVEAQLSQNLNVYSSESLQRVGNLALLQDRLVLEGTGNSDCS